MDSTLKDTHVFNQLHPEAVRATRFERRGFLMVLAAALLSCTNLSTAQTHTPTASLVPPPDPGYSLYYHDSDSVPNFAARWGYHDGWEDGRHDRNHGDTLQAQEKDRYASPPEHGVHPGITRQQYMKEYRIAFLHGYEHGSRI
jgi:hypothetical protein